MAGGERKDARRSRRRILAAARELLAGGNEPSFADIAHAASLGQATVYRHFDDHEELLAALTDESMDRLEAASRELGPSPTSLAELIDRAIAEQVACPGLTAAIRRGELGEGRTEQLTERVSGLFAEHLAAAREAGAVRAELDVEDVLIVLAMVDGTLTQVGDSGERERLAERALALVRRGLVPSD